MEKGQVKAMPWGNMISSALMVTLPLILGLSRGELALGVFASLLAYFVFLIDPAGSLGERLLNLVLATAFLCGGFLLGQYIGSNNWGFFYLFLFPLVFGLGLLASQGGG